jgi:hypothetical protein
MEEERMEFNKLAELLAQKGVKIVCQDSRINDWTVWTPDNDFTNYIYLEKDHRRIYLDIVTRCQTWRRKGVSLTELCKIRSLLESIRADKEAIPFVELVRHLIDENGGWSDYVKAVIQIENEQASPEAIERAYDFFVETDDCTLISPMIDEVVSNAEVVAVA